MTRSARAALGGERGSALLISLVLIFVMTLLGLALFDLAAIENRLVFGSETEARAFEIAQAGLERALERLQRTFLDEHTALDVGLLPNGPNWADGSTPSTGGVAAPLCSGGCATGEFRVVDDGYIAAASKSFNGGSYEISFKLVTVAEATDIPYGQTCRPDPAAPANCSDLIFVRSTGTLAGPPVGYTPTRTIQALARATLTTPYAAAVFAAAPAAQAINGNALIAGSIHVVGDRAGVPALAFDLGSGAAGQRNNWFGIDGSCNPASSICTSNRLLPIPTVCAPGMPCASAADRVESLGATLRVWRPYGTPAVSLSGVSSLGQPAASPLYGAGTAGNPSRRGKGRIDGVFAGDGCVMPCTDSFTGASAIHADGGNLTKPYPDNPVPTFPLLTDSTTITGPFGTFTGPYACPPGSACFGQPDFFLQSAGLALNLLRCNPAGRCPAGTTTGIDPPCPNAALCPSGRLGGLLSNLNGLNENTGAFSTDVFQFRNAPASTGGSTLFNGRICWKPGGALPGNTLVFAAAPAPTTPDCLNATHRLTPVLAWFDNIDINIFEQTTSGADEIQYAGRAIILQGSNSGRRRKVNLDAETLQSFCAAAPCAADKYPRDHLLALLTFGDIEVGVRSTFSTTLDRVMALFYSQNDFKVRKRSRLVGAAVANRFCFAGTCGLASGGVAEIYQVPLDPRDLPPELFPLSFAQSNRRWRVSHVPGFWTECRAGSPPASPSSPATPTGICGYQ